MMQSSPRHISLMLAVCAVLSACAHSSPTEADPITPQGPLAVGNDVRLTTNPGSDYWPSWSEDGTGLLYRYSQPGHADDDRCIGLVPAAGGTQLWHLCDTRIGDADTSSSFVGVALGADGRLLYQEFTAKKNKINPDRSILWLADTAAPFTRTPLITFPVFVGPTSVPVLSDVQWTSPTQFIALAQGITFTLPCRGCPPPDTLFNGLAVVRGTIAGAGTTLSQVDGTSQAATYSLAASGATIVFVRSTLNVEQVPATGGTPTIVTTFPVTGNRSILGLTCLGGACIVLTSETLPAVPPNLTPFPTWSLWKVMLADGAQTFLRSSTTPLLTPRVSPLTGDVVVQSGLKSAGDLYLYKGLLP